MEISTSKLSQGAVASLANIFRVSGILELISRFSFS